MKCDRCNKEMTNPEGTTLAGIQIVVRTDTEGDREFMQKQLGRYKFNKEYSFCYECWLDSLMGI